MNKIKIIGLSLLLITFSVNCFATTEDLKTYEESKTVSLEDSEKYKNSIKTQLIINGIEYQIKDIQEQENKVVLTKEKEEQEQKIVKINDKYKILNLFESKKPKEEDGYSGILELQNNSLDLRVNNSYVEQYKVSVQKEYNNVPQNELNNIPKIIEEAGTVYYLVNPVWNIAQTQKIDEQDIPTLYSGIMNYEGIQERRVINNYIATVNYKGVLQKEEVDSITYHLTYEEIQKEEPVEEPIEKSNNIYTPVIITTGMLICSGFIIYRRKNVFIYNNKNGEWKLVKKLYISRNKRLINITPIVPMSTEYKIILNNRLYNEIINENVTIKYFDKKYIYQIKEQEIYINV